MTGRGRRRRPRRGDYLTELQRDLTFVRRPNLLVVLWRWRWELMLAFGLPTELSIIGIRLGWAWALVAVGAILTIFTAWPGARYWLVAHARCVVTAHRVRTGCAQAWIQTRHGKLPIILLTGPQPYGERVYIWCRAGITLEDFEEAKGILRSACWASDIRVTSSSRYSHIVVLDVIRHENID